MNERESNFLLVTPYLNPDLDGTACSYGYAEFLCKNGRNAIIGIFGMPDRESQFVLNFFNIDQPQSPDDLAEEAEGIVLVDASDTRGLSDKVNPDSVIELIDHRPINDAHDFPNAKIQIEMVGSAATLIAEKFHDSKTPISPQVAALLFSAIVSNTVNFQAGVTTKRDSKMADWCSEHFNLPPNYVSKMFAAKSKIEGPLEDILMFATFHFGNYTVGISQLEINDVDDFIEKNLSEIKKILNAIKQKKDLDMALLSCIDVGVGFNKIIASDKKTETCLREALGVNFNQSVAERPGVLMRKEIAPLIEKVLRNA